MTVEDSEEPEEWGMGDETWSPGDEHGLLFPFVVCVSKGGPYEDGAFAAGFQAGQIYQALGNGMLYSIQFTVRTDLLPQLDLIAMHFGFTVDVAATEYPDAWTFWTATRAKRT